MCTYTVVNLCASKLHAVFGFVDDLPSASHQCNEAGLLYVTERGFSVW